MVTENYPFFFPFVYIGKRWLLEDDAELYWGRCNITGDIASYYI
jgi:hypothetical protein